MSEITLPRELQTNSKMASEKVPVDTVVTIKPSPEDVDRLQKDLGMIQITGARLQALHDVGLHVEQIGGLRTWKGGMFLTQDAVLQTIGRLGQIVADPDAKPKDVTNAATALSALTNALTRLSTGAVKMDRDVAEVTMQADDIKRNSFRPGHGMHLKAVTPIKV